MITEYQDKKLKLHPILKILLIIALILTLFLVVYAVAPSVPTLVSPVNASTNQPLDVLLQVNVTDGDGGTLNVSFYQYISSNHQTDDTEDKYNYTYNANPERYWEIDHNETDCVDEDWDTYGDGISNTSLGEEYEDELYIYEYFNLPNNISTANLTVKLNYSGGYWCYVTDWYGSCDNYQYNFTGNVSGHDYYDGSSWKDIPLNIYGNVSGTNMTALIPSDALNNLDGLFTVRTRLSHTYTQTYSATGYGDEPGWYKLDISVPIVYYESRVDWYGDELGLIGKDLTVAVNEIATTQKTNQLENWTYYWFANVSDGGDITQSYIYYFTTGNKPLITNYNFNDSTPEYLENVYIYANVTDYDSDTIQNVTYVLSYPDDSVATYYNTSGTDGYKTDLISLNQYGVFSANITAFANNDSSVVQTLNYDISIGNLSSNPASWIFSQQSGTQSTDSFNLTHTADSWVEYNVSIEGVELNYPTNFTYELTTSNFNISKDGNYMLDVNITSNSSLPNGTYYGNISVYRIYDGEEFKIPITATVSTSGVGVINLIDYPSNYKSVTITQSNQLQWDLKINNTGNRTLTNCNVSISGTASSFTTLLNHQSFSIAIGTVHTTTVQQQPLSTGNYQGMFQVTCTATAEGGLDTETLTEDISVIASGNGGGGGGGGGASSDQQRCNLLLTDKVIITKRSPVQLIEIKNLNDFSYAPITKISVGTLGKDGSKLITIKGDVGAIQPDSKGQLSVLMKDASVLDTINETYYAVIEVSSTECLPEYVQVEISEGSVVSEFVRLFTDYDYFKTTLKTFFTKKISMLGFDVPVYLISLLIAVISIVINALIFRGKSEAKTKIIVFSLISTFIAEVLFWIIL